MEWDADSEVGIARRNSRRASATAQAICDFALYIFAIAEMSAALAEVSVALPPMRSDVASNMGPAPAFTALHGNVSHCDRLRALDAAALAAASCTHDRFTVSAAIQLLGQLAAAPRARRAFGACQKSKASVAMASAGSFFEVIFVRKKSARPLRPLRRGSA